MSCENARKHINQNLIPEMYKTYLQETPNNHLSIEEFLEYFGLCKKGISHTTTWKWLNEFGFVCKERQKSYFSDKHENEENVSYRKKFVHEYFETELNMYRWVHLKEDIAKK